MTKIICFLLGHKVRKAKNPIINTYCGRCHAVEVFETKLLCYILGHKKIHLEGLYTGEIDGWFCNRCNYTHIDKQH